MLGRQDYCLIRDDVLRNQRVHVYNARTSRTAVSLLLNFHSDRQVSLSQVVVPR